MNRAIVVGLCGISPRDARMSEIVLARATGAGHKYSVVDATTVTSCDVALVDVQSPHASTVLHQLRGRCPNVVPAYISDTGTLGDSRFRICRGSLLLLLQRTLEQIAKEELSGAARSSITRPAAAPVASSGPTVGINPPGAETPNNASALTPARNGTVVPLAALVVDDSLTVRRQLDAALERVGIQCVSAENADEAMKELTRRNFDLVFLDVVMPGIDGYELCRKIKQNVYTRGIPISMLTSRSSPFDRARGALAGCDSYLLKPITWESFYAAIHKLLAKQFHDDPEKLTARGYRPVAREKTNDLECYDP